MRWSVQLVLFAMLSMGACTNHSGAEQLSAHQVGQDIQNGDPHAAVRRLWDSGVYDRILSKIAGGDSEWIALAPKLAKGADASASEGLSVALAQALPRNPGAVLLAINQSETAISTEKVCGVPFIEGTISDVRTYVQQAEAAVSSVSATELGGVRSACLAALHNS